MDKKLNILYNLIDHLKNEKKLFLKIAFQLSRLVKYYLIIDLCKILISVWLIYFMSRSNGLEYYHPALYLKLPMKYYLSRP